MYDNDLNYCEYYQINEDYYLFRINPSDIKKTGQYGYLIREGSVIRGMPVKTIMNWGRRLSEKEVFELKLTGLL